MSLKTRRRRGQVVWFVVRYVDHVHVKVVQVGKQIDEFSHKAGRTLTGLDLERSYAEG